MKKILVCLLAVLLVLTTTIPAVAAAGADVAPSGDTYSVVSAVANTTYDFKEDFHDSYPYDEDFETVGIFELNDYNGDVTLTLKNNTTGETFVYEKTATAEWAVKASVDHLLYENTQLDAVVHIYNLGQPYGISETDIPVTISVNSSQYSADFHRYPSYYANTVMYEDVDYTLDYNFTTKKAKLTIMQVPRLFWMDVYDVVTKQTVTFDQDNANFVFADELEIKNYDTSSRSFWFFIPSKLILEDGYEYEFTLSVSAHAKEYTPTVIDSGTTGDCQWTLADDTLTIAGSGAMADYQNNNGKSSALWASYNIGKVVVGSGVTNIGNWAFFDLDCLTAATIGNSVTSIGVGAFDHCDAMTTASIPASVTDIGDCAFDSCCNLSGVTIPDSVVTIGDFAFYNCAPMTDVTIPDSVTQIGTQAFGYYVDPYDHLPVKSRLTIHGFTGTSAETYAKNNGFTFKQLPMLSTPKITKVENTVDGVKITIDKVTGAAKYRYYRKTGSGGWQKLGDTDKTTWTDKTASSGTKYTYTVRCLSKGAKSFTSDFDKAGKSITFIAAPKITKLENTAKGTKLTWSKSKGAAKFRVYVKSGSSGWKKIADTTATSYVNTQVKSGSSYTYTVRCISNDGKRFTSSYDATGKTYKFVATPAAPTLKNTKSGVSVSWKKPAGATKCRIYRKTGSGKWTKLADTTGTSYVDKSAKSGTTYAYTIRCISADAKSFTSYYNTKGSSIKCKK